MDQNSHRHLPPDPDDQQAVRPHPEAFGVRTRDLAATRRAKARADYERAIALTTSKVFAPSKSKATSPPTNTLGRRSSLLWEATMKGHARSTRSHRFMAQRSATRRHAIVPACPSHIAEGNHKLAAIRLDEAPAQAARRAGKDRDLRLRMQVACALEDHPSFHGPAPTARPGVSEAAKRRATALTARCRLMPIRSARRIERL